MRNEDFKRSFNLFLDLRKKIQKRIKAGVFIIETERFVCASANSITSWGNCIVYHEAKILLIIYNANCIIKH